MTILMAPLALFLVVRPFALWNGGEVWVIYLLKLFAKAAYLYLVDRLLRWFEVDGLSRLAVIVFLLFHPALLDLMPFTADGWVALLLSALLMILVWKRAKMRDAFDLATFSWRRWAACAGVSLLALGVKEVACVFIGVLTLLFTIRTEKRRLWLVTPYYAMLALWFYRLNVMKGVNRPQGDRIALFWRALAAHAYFVTTHFPFHLVGISLVILVAVAVLREARWDRRDKLWLYALLLFSSGGMLLFASDVQAPAPRYVIPSVVLLSLPLGMALNVLRWNPIKYAFILAFPLWMASDLYSQALAYQQALYEDADVITLLERKAGDGYALALSGDNADIPLALYFYQSDPVGKVAFLNRDGLPDGPCVLLSSRPLATVLGGGAGFDTARIRTVEAFKRGRYGLIEKLANFYGAVDAGIGHAPQPFYDNGAPVKSSVPAFYVYTLAAKGATEADAVPLDVTIEYNNYTRGTDRRMAIQPGSVYDFEAGENEKAKVSILLQRPNPGAVIVYTGDVKVSDGNVLFGVSDAEGHDVWTAALKSGQDWKPLPPIPPLNLAAGKDYFAFFFTQTKARFSIKNLHGKRNLQVHMLEPERRYGAMFR